MAERAFDLQVRSSCFDPDSTQGRIQVREQGDAPLYRVFLFLAGRDLPYVESVTYVLHPTFPNPRRTVRRTPTNPLCKLEAWAWGEFAMTSEIVLKTGDTVAVGHQFAFSDEVEKAKKSTPDAFEY